MQARITDSERAQGWQSLHKIALCDGTNVAEASGRDCVLAVGSELARGVIDRTLSELASVRCG